MSQLQTPDDSDCNTVMQTALLEEGISAPQAAEIAIEACAGIASMRTDMQADMNSGGESIETNLWDATNWHAVNNLYFEHSTDGVRDAKISFSQPIDFMSYNFMNFMMNFGDNMKTNQAYISLDADTVGGFANYGASLTMYNVPHFDNSVILVNGEQDTNGVVSNLVYNEENNTLTFSAAHFSSFEAVEGSSLDTPNIKRVKARKFMSSNGKKRIRMVIEGKNFDKNTKIKLGSRDTYKTRRNIKKGTDTIKVFFDMENLINSGHRKLTVHAINSGSSSSDYDDKINLEDLKALKFWKYEKIYKDHKIEKRQKALNFAKLNPEYIRE